jgi:hypothetical protein
MVISLPDLVIVVVPPCMKSTVSLSSTDSAVPPLADKFQLYISAKAAHVLSPLKYVVASLVPVADKSIV